MKLNPLGATPLRVSRIGIGLSVSGPRQAAVIEAAADLNVDGVRLFDCVQATWNLLEKSAGAALAGARDAGVGVIIKEALANGRLTDRNPEPAFASRMKRLKREAHRLGTTVDGLALAAACAQPWVDVVLSGATKVAHLKSNLGALEVKWDAQAASALDGLTESAEVYWERRGGLEWN